MKEFVEFIERFFDKDRVKNLVELFGLGSSGTKEDLLRKLQQSELNGINFVLFRDFDKNALMKFCKYLNINPSGTKKDLERKLIEKLKIPEKYISNHDYFKIKTNGTLHLYYIDSFYILKKYFNKDDLKEICREHNLPISGKIDDIISRILSKINFKAILHQTDSDILESICEELSIHCDYLTDDEMIDRIMVKVKKREGEKNIHIAENKKYKYDIAISFAGEDRAIAEQIKNALIKKGIRVFYDKDEMDDLLGKNLFDHFSEIYSESARYCIMLISKNYATKHWTNHERQNAQERSLREGKEYILPIRLDDTKIKGLPATIAYIDFNNTSINGIANTIEKKLSK